MAILTEYRPSIWGWPFTNLGVNWCGGFAFTSMDRYYATGNPPPDEGTLETNDQLKSRIFAKQFQAVVHYGGAILKWQMRPDIGHWHHMLHSIRHEVRGYEWPELKRRLEVDGTPVPLAEIRAEGLDEAPTNNHFVVAWGFDENGEQVDVRIYDPNRPGNDDVRIQFTTSGDWRCSQTHSAQRCRGFFCCDYPL